MGLFDFFGGKPAPRMPGGRHSIFDTDYPINRRSWEHVLSACIGPSVIMQEAFAEQVVQNRGWNVDFGAGTLAFGQDSYPVQFIGSESSLSSTWMWGWNNINRFDPRILKLAEEMHALGKKWQLSVFTEAQFDLTETKAGHFLSAAAAVLSQGKYCYYRGPHAKGAAFMAVSGLPETVFAPAPMLVIAETLQRVITQLPVDHRILTESLLMWNGTNYEWKGDRLSAHADRDLHIDFERSGGVLRIREIRG